MANNNIKAIIKQKRPIASDSANPRMAYENNCAFKPGFLAKPMIKLPNTDPIPAPGTQQTPFSLKHQICNEAHAISEHTQDYVYCTVRCLFSSFQVIRK